MDLTMTALAEPRRRDILQVLGNAELPAGEGAARFAVSRTAISQHVQVLKAAGLVTERRDGVRRLYRARPEGLDELRAWIDGFWREGLDRLRSEAERERSAP